jgi:hypothetical protein
MSWLGALFHALNFFLPAAFVAAVMGFSGCFFKKKRPAILSFPAEFAIHFVACSAVLVLGLVLSGRDGKMLTYAAMVLASAALQWALQCGPMTGSDAGKK